MADDADGRSSLSHEKQGREAAHTHTHTQTERQRDKSPLPRYLRRVPPGLKMQGKACDENAGGKNKLSLGFCARRQILLRSSRAEFLGHSQAVCRYPECVPPAGEIRDRLAVGC